MNIPESAHLPGLKAPSADLQASLKNLSDAGRQWILTQLNQLSLTQAPPHSETPTLEPWRKSEINVILVGETGVGKTTFMSYIDNMCRGRSVEEFQNTYNRSAERGGQVSESQTYKATLYTFERKNTGSTQVVRILDTPGLGDTRGIEQDNVQKKLIVEEIQRTLKTVDAIIVMTNGTYERLGISANYALENIKAMFPRSLLDNIGFILSNCTSSRASFDMRSLPPELQNAEHWMIENPLALWNKYQASKDRGLVRNDEDIEEIKLDVDKAYNDGVKTLNKFFAWLDKRSVQPTKSILDLYDRMNHIDTEITNILSRIAAAEKTRISVLDLQHQIDQSDRIINLNRRYTKTLTRTRWVREDTSYHNTLCTFTNCHSNCDKSCRLGFVMDPKQLGNSCFAFKGQPGQGLTRTCKMCGHRASYHRHYTNLWVLRQYTESEVNFNAKWAFEGATSDKQRIQTLRRSAQVNLGELEQELRRRQDQVSNLCEQYGKTAISPSFTSYVYATIQYLQQLLESRKKTAAPADELGRLERLIQDMMGRYKIVAGRAYTP